MQIKFKCKEFEMFLWKKDAFDCAEIRAQVFHLPVDCSNQLSYTDVRQLLLHRKTSLYRLVTLQIQIQFEFKEFEI